MKKKDLILDTAIRLFNQHGTSAVSTNHIAEAAGISPGNLYYHFRNKEEIIRAIFERLFHEWDVGFVLPDDRLPTVEDVKNLVRINFQIMGKYAFTYRELLALLRQDDQLHTRFIAVRQRGFEGFRGLFAFLSEVGVIVQPESPDTVTGLAELIWMVSEFWLATVEVNGEYVNEAQMQHGIDLMILVLQPYLRS